MSKKPSYDLDTYNRAHIEFVEKGYSPRKISDEMGGSPHHQTIRQWAKKPNKKTGKDWYDEREELRQKKYESSSPQAITLKILDKINDLLKVENFTPKDADALAKLQSSLNKIVDRKFQIPVMFDMLENLVRFARNRHPKVCDDDFIIMIREFKNDLYARLNQGSIT
jgi:hypothetical protein